MNAQVSTANQDLSVNGTGIEEFRSNLRGPLLLPGEDGYDQARAVWNGMIDKRPAQIARCVSAADVIQCVNFARTQGMVVSVRGGGHSFAGRAVCDGGLMIDLSLMKGAATQVDPTATALPPTETRSGTTTLLLSGPIPLTRRKISSGPVPSGRKPNPTRAAQV